MLLNLLHQVINTDAIRRVVPLKAGASGPRVLVTWNDGSTEEIAARFQVFEGVCGRIVPAPIGYQVVEAYQEGADVGFLDPAPVVAFRIDGVDTYDIVPIAIDGEPTGAAWALVLPDGSCCVADQRKNHDIEAWKAETLAKLKLPSNGSLAEVA